MISLNKGHSDIAFHKKKFRKSGRQHFSCGGIFVILHSSEMYFIPLLFNIIILKSRWMSCLGHSCQLRSRNPHLWRNKCHPPHSPLLLPPAHLLHLLRLVPQPDLARPPLRLPDRELNEPELFERLHPLIKGGIADTTQILHPGKDHP